MGALWTHVGDWAYVAFKHFLIEVNLFVNLVCTVC